MKCERGTCFACGRRAVERCGEAEDGRPQYVCRNYQCGQSYTNGINGESWDSKERRKA